MNFKKLLRNITIKQANIFTVLVIFLFTMIFVGLLVEEMYQDYERMFEQSKVIKSGIYTENELLAQKHDTLKSFFIKISLAIITLSFILFAVFLGLNNLFNKLLQRDTQTFLDFFAEAAHYDQVINPNLIFFKDFKIMVGYANEMLDKIHEQKRSLKDMNLSLEERVKEKTKNLEEEKNFSQNLLKSQKEFLRYTVHETNTPLSVILTSIELYVMKHPKDRQLSKIEAATKNIFSIYDDLSYLVKKDQIEYPKTAINIQEYLTSRLDFFSEVAELSKVEFINRSTESKALHVYINETKLQRIIDNTITNAIKYTQTDEKVFVELKPVGLHVELSVSSKSKHIENVDKVFDSFYREEKNRDGFGLGLGLVKSICDEENIKIIVNSVNEKTSFTYKFKMMGE